jgi:D-glycero-D-manno-heptose 1,7-bisphosphate phosphatase
MPVTGPLLPAIFLDRDGVIIENRADYVRSWADVAIYPQALRALAAVRDWPCRVAIVTNQSVVGRGHISLATAEAINERLVTAITKAGGRVDGVFMCPHAPDARCSCRKPEPGLLHAAAQALNVDLAHSVLVGDALTDLLAGKAAQLGATALLATGRGRSQLRLPASGDLHPFHHFPDLEAALAQLRLHQGLFWPVPPASFS